MSTFEKRKTPVVICITLLTVGIFLYNLHKTKISYAIRVLTTSHHTVSYDGIGFYPEFTVVQLGDSVIVKNSSQKLMEIAVGKHENHEALQGFQEKIIKPETTYTFTPREKGVFYLHDHLNPKKLGILVIDE